MRVLLVTGSYPPMRCGVGDYSHKLARVLSASSNVTVGVLTSLSCKREVNDQVEVFPVIEKWSLTEVTKIIKVIRNWRPDIVHIQYPTQGYRNGWLPWIVPIVSFLMRKKVVQTWHGGDGMGDALKFFMKLIVPTKIVVVHLDYQENFHPLLGSVMAWKGTVFIPNASAIPRALLEKSEKNRIKESYLKQQKRLIVFFGFVYPHKGVELLFEIANHDTDQLIIAGEIDKNSEYYQKIIKFCSVGKWRDKVTIAGFMSSADIAVLLAVSDAVVLPFRIGGGDWNTSIHGAVLNGAFVVTTSFKKNGYDKQSNVYYSKVDDVQEMQIALDTYAGTSLESKAVIEDGWKDISEKHYELYENLGL